MNITDQQIADRRQALRQMVGAVACTVATVMVATEAQARPWGAPPGWSRGRKRGWRKKGGPKWRW